MDKTAFMGQLQIGTRDGGDRGETAIDLLI